MNRLSVDNIDFNNKRVLVRVDYNVPLKDGKVDDAARIEASLPTLNKILNDQPKSLVLMSHLGRPKGKVKPKLSLKCIVPTLEGLLNRKVQFLDDCCGDEIENQLKNPPHGSIFLLENLRFHKEEEDKNVTSEKVKRFRSSLTNLGDVYVNDAFGTAHRSHSSMVGINLPQRAAGYLMKKELDAFSQIISSPKRPFVAILGGAKVKDKIPLIKSMLDRVNEVYIGGGMVFTFTKVLYNMKIGNSLFDDSAEQIVKEIWNKAKECNVKIHLPIDFVIGKNIKGGNDNDVKVVSMEDGIPDGYMGLDIGPKSCHLLVNIIKNAKTAFVNGALGVFEVDEYANGTAVLMRALARQTQLGCCSILGGGDTGNAAQKFNVDKYMTHVSTGGGASIELMEGRSLPGIDFLSPTSNL